MGFPLKYFLHSKRFKFVKMTPLFTEQQRFTQWWVWVLLIGIGILPILAIYYQFVLGEEFGDNPMSNWGVVLFAIPVFGAILLFSFMRLKTEITHKEIRMSFIPF